MITCITGKIRSGSTHGDHLQVTVKERDALFNVYHRKSSPEYFLIRVNEFHQGGDNPLEEAGLPEKRL